MRQGEIGRVTEGREAVQGLRASTVERDLAAAITPFGEALTPQIYRIASEALRNAFRHAEAKQIEVELRYDERQFRLQVRDDGKGIGPNFLA